MTDIVFVAVAIAFFALCVAYVIGCDRIIGVDNAASESDTALGETEVAAK